MENRSLVNQEAQLPIASTNFGHLTDYFFKPKIVFHDRSQLVRYLVIVITIPGGEMTSSSSYHNNYYSFLGYQLPRKQHAMVIFGSPDSPGISS